MDEHVHVHEGTEFVCPNCGCEVEPDADKCPVCGFPLHEKPDMDSAEMKELSSGLDNGTESSDIEFIGAEEKAEKPKAEKKQKMKKEEKSVKHKTKKKAEEHKAVQKHPKKKGLFGGLFHEKEEKKEIPREYRALIKE